MREACTRREVGQSDRSSDRHGEGSIPDDGARDSLRGISDSTRVQHSLKGESGGQGVADAVDRALGIALIPQDDSVGHQIANIQFLCRRGLAHLDVRPYYRDGRLGRAHRSDSVGCCHGVGVRDQACLGIVWHPGPVAERQLAACWYGKRTLPHDLRFKGVDRLDQYFTAESEPHVVERYWQYVGDGVERNVTDRGIGEDDGVRDRPASSDLGRFSLFDHRDGSFRCWHDRWANGQGSLQHGRGARRLDRDH